MYRLPHEPPEVTEAFERCKTFENLAAGRASNVKGRRAELRSLAALMANLPKWAQSVRLATSQEDARGIDLVIETARIGPLYIQIKSSRTGAFIYRQKRRRARTIIVVVPENISEDKLAEKLHGAIHRCRREIIFMRL